MTVFKISKLRDESKGTKQGTELTRFTGFYHLMYVAFRLLFQKKVANVISVHCGTVEVQKEPQPGLLVETCGFVGGNPYKLVAVMETALGNHKNEMKEQGLHVCEDADCVADAIGGKKRGFAMFGGPGNLPPEVKEAIESLLGVKLGDENKPTKH
jgi:hypothetical protein